MPSIYVKLDGQNVVEACLEKLDGGIEVNCTEQQLDDIMNHYDATCDGQDIIGTSIGEEAQKFADMKAAKNQFE